MYIYIFKAAKKENMLFIVRMAASIKLSTVLALLTCLSTSIQFCLAGDSDNLYDFCPTDMTHRKIFINGFPCKDPQNVTASDFKSSLLNEAGDTDNFYRSSMTFATAAEFPGLNTLGLSAARIDIEVDGSVMPHAHPRATEMIFIRAGVVVAGFVDSSNQVFQTRLDEGGVFVFPKGLLHYCFNAGFEQATIFSVLNSQNPGLASIAGAMFGSNGADAKVMLMEKLKSKGDLNGVSSVHLFG